jgi:hypothetical protein
MAFMRFGITRFEAGQVRHCDSYAVPGDKKIREASTLRFTAATVWHAFSVPVLSRLPSPPCAGTVGFAVSPLRGDARPSLFLATRHSLLATLLA